MESALKVLIIDSNPRTVKDITFCLEIRYPATSYLSARLGGKGIELIESEAPELVVLGSSLPDMDVPKFIRATREFSEVALIVLCENLSDIDVAGCLEAGADDAIIMPFSPIDFLARVKGLLRRTQGLGFSSERSLSVTGDLTINFATREVFLSSRKVKLTPTEYRLLSELVRNEGRVVTHRTLLEKAWGPEYTLDQGFLKKYIFRLRKKLEPDTSQPRILLSERSIGYRFMRPVKI
jgi:DNA-binding response OmpR family regulator